MSGRSRLVASSGVAIAGILISVFGMVWFHLQLDVANTGTAHIQIGLHSATACMTDAACQPLPLSNFDGLYPTLATFTFYISLAFVAIVAYQTGQYLVGRAGDAVSRIGYFLVILGFLGAVFTGWVFAPEAGANEVASLIVHRTFAPGLMLLGFVAGVYALMLAERGEPAASSSVSLPIAQARPVIASEPIVPLAMSRVPSYESVVIARAPTSPPRPPTVPPRAATPLPAVYIRYATVKAVFGSNGLEAEREDGSMKKVFWPDVVGIVARRLPADPPYHSETFVDIVSIAGSTLRFLPWTEIDCTALDGALSTGDEAERARTFVQLVAMACPEARLDSATRTFLGGRGPAAQLPNADTLAQHDERLA